MSILIQEAVFDIADEISKLHHQNPKVGALVNFIGYMRDFNEGDTVSRLFLEHYSGMTEKALQKINDEACQRWDLIDIRVIHRIGLLHPCDPIVFIGVTSCHRKEAFLATEFIIDFLKNRAPFWKKEVTTDKTRWVSHRQSDLEAQARWEEKE